MNSPLIDPSHLTDPYDVEMSINGAELSREIMSQLALAPYIGSEHFPAAGVRSRKDIETFIRRFGRTAHHPVGSCKMGSDDLAVVDPQLRIRGVDGLRVANGSIMSSLVNSNTNFPCMKIGERASEMILGNG